MKHIGENVVRIEAEALLEPSTGSVDQRSPFSRAVELIFSSSGRIAVTGMGKSDIIARSIGCSAQLTRTPALFMHPVEAVHGDQGMMERVMPRSRCRRAERPKKYCACSRTLSSCKFR